MEKYIVAVNILSAVIIFLSAVIIIVRFYKNKIRHKILLVFALIILLTGPIINVLEHISILKDTEQFEQILSVLFLPILIFAIYESIIGKELQKQIRSEQKFKGIFNQTFSFVALLDNEGKIIEVNTTACDFAGCTKNEYTGIYLTDSKWCTHSEEEKEKLQNAIEQAKAGKLIRYETTHSDTNQKIHDIDLSLKPVNDLEGDTIYLIVEGRDITEIKQAKLELEKHKKNLEDIVQKRTSQLETANRELQTSNETLLEKNTIINEQNTKLTSTLENLKNTQLQLLQAEKMASLGILTAGVAHEINNPLNYILGAYEALKEQGPCMEENNTEILLDALKTGVERISNIVKSLNQFSRDTSSVNEECNIHEIIDNCLVMLQSQLKNRIDISKNYINETFVIPGNVGNIHQVFLNILSNAEQAIKGEGKITITTSKIGEQFTIEISDNGQGIAKEDINKITDPFYTTKDPGQGTGLGLSIAYTIIKEHGGSLQFESELHKGTIAKIIFPQNGRNNE